MRLSWSSLASNSTRHSDRQQSEQERNARERSNRTGGPAKIAGLSRAEPIETETEADARHMQRDRGDDEACGIGKE